MKKYYRPDSEIIEASIDPKDRSSLSRKVQGFFKEAWEEHGMEVWLKQNDRRCTDIQKPSAWLAFLSGLRVIPIISRRDGPAAGEWVRINSRELHLAVLVSDGLLLVPESTIEKLIVLEQI
jgi:hypothetical protein